VAFTPGLNAPDTRTAFAEIKVPLRLTTRGFRSGSKTLRLTAMPSTGGSRARDTDTLTLVCRPQP
jgi:hypothetical protein